ncbi:MAG: N-acetylmuramoyl-L-alanine amidase [Prevotellaceae bacterium]|jgi:N-acetylmuramoyl-L-alanine amidase|nr:N-acetylmuramoyl-L-alanine amidase [Prevotellaceae bacterium]
MNIKHIKRLLFYTLSFLIFTTFTSNLGAQEKKFVLVIDPGHGGEDPGAIGSIAKEKNINLAVALEFGESVKKNHADVKVVYTRNTDNYLTLQERADIANKNHADLFVSIHTNSVKSQSAYGAETYTLGLAKTKDNLEVAMKENAVILLEEDYETKYQGFDPNSVDSYIIFEFMQDIHIDQSLETARLIQEQFAHHAKRHDRGVRQAGFWVLHRSACPSVLIELGFISNKNEERYLMSKSGQKEMAKAIYNAFSSYKRGHSKRSGTGSSSAAPDNTKQATETANNSQQIVFKLQIFATKTQLKTGAAEFKGLENVDFYLENGMYKYVTGTETQFEKINQLKKKLSDKFPEAFIIAFQGDKKIAVKDALNRLK